PAPRTLEAFFGELIDRIELSIVTAPSPDFATEPNALLDAVMAFDDALADVEYDIDQVPSDALDAEGEVINATQEDLATFLSTQCESSVDIAAEAAALADQFIALGGDVTDPAV